MPLSIILGIGIPCIGFDVAAKFSTARDLTLPAYTKYALYPLLTLVELN